MLPEAPRHFSLSCFFEKADSLREEMLQASLRVSQLQGQLGDYTLEVIHKTRINRVLWCTHSFDTREKLLLLSLNPSHPQSKCIKFLRPPRPAPLLLGGAVETRREDAKRSDRHTSCTGTRIGCREGSDTIPSIYFNIYIFIYQTLPVYMYRTISPYFLIWSDSILYSLPPHSKYAFSFSTTHLFLEGARRTNYCVEGEHPNSRKRKKGSQPREPNDEIWSSKHEIHVWWSPHAGINVRSIILEAAGNDRTCQKSKHQLPSNPTAKK